MVDLVDPSVSYTNAFNAAQNVTDTFRKNMAFKALEKTYGPIVGDMKLATDVQAYEQNELMNPLKVDAQQLANEALTQTNAFNKANNPLVLQGNTIANEQSQFNLDQGQEEAARAEKIRKAQEMHTTLGGVLDNVEAQLANVIDPNERLAVFDRNVTELAPLIGADPEELLHSLAQQRAAVAAQGIGAIQPIRQSLDDMLYAGMTPKEKADLELSRAKIITEGAQAEKALADAETAKIKTADEAQKVVKEGRAAARALDDFEAKQEIVQSYIADAIQYAKDHPLATGAAASTPGLNQLPEIKNLAAKLKTIGANIGFAELSRIKSTGATLGPVSNYENELLQSVQGAIEQGMSQEEFIASMQELGETLKGSAERLRAAYQEDFGDVDSEDGGGPIVDASDYFKD